ncbi:MAG: hypothetical protein HY657_16960 [Acidobacteria bacterium]|nr:hypothetical protein [Acidobacteriota bacterium]
MRRRRFAPLVVSTDVHRNPLKSTLFVEAFWRRRESAKPVLAAFVAEAGSRRLQTAKLGENIGFAPNEKSALSPRTMGDIVERKMWNGREFLVTLRESPQPDRVYWIGWIQVVGKEGLKGSSESFTGLSEGDVREKAERWMIKWKN